MANECWVLEWIGCVSDNVRNDNVMNLTAEKILFTKVFTPF